MAGHDMSMERWPDYRLLREASKGNTDAFNEFCVRSLPSLHRFVKHQCLQYNVSPSLVEDFCNDAIVRAIERIKAIKESGQPPLPRASVAWLKQIALNAIRDWRRRSYRYVTLDDFDELEAEPIIGAEESAEFEEIRKFVNWLIPNEREIIEMVLVEKLGIAEAGKRLNLESWAAYKTYERGIGHLRDLLEQHGQHLLSWINGG